MFSKTSEDIKRLKDKIQPTDRTINIQEIIGLDKCVSAITKMKKLEDNFRIFEYIKSMKKEEISDFENYSKIYPSTIELDSNDDFSDNIYVQVIKVIKNASFNFLQDTENFLYYDQDKGKYEVNISMEDLIHLKNQIHISSEKEASEDDIIKSKSKILIWH